MVNDRAGNGRKRWPRVFADGKQVLGTMKLPTRGWVTAETGQSGEVALTGEYPPRLQNSLRIHTLLTEATYELKPGALSPVPF